MSFWTGAVLPRVPGDAFEQSDGRHHDDHECPSVADEWEGQAGNRQETNGHANVNKYMTENQGCNAGGEEFP